MKEQLRQLIHLALLHHASDLHFVCQQHQVSVKLRGPHGMEELHSALVDEALFHYLKYIANLDLGNSDHAQSGSFAMEVDGQSLYFRFSLICSFFMQTGVLRILNNHKQIHLQDLSDDPAQIALFHTWTKQNQGMVLMSGPTGSGKSTTLHAILDEIAKQGTRKIMTLEDPIEMYDERYVQLAVNEAQGFSYEEGIRQLMRHDPDVIMIGEIRDPDSAKMAYRCALTGHMVFSTIHAKNAQEALKRLRELGVEESELQNTLSAVCAQRLYPKKADPQTRICIYEILSGAALQKALAKQEVKGHASIHEKVRQAIAQGLVEETLASGDLYTETL